MAKQSVGTMAAGMAALMGRILKLPPFFLGDDYVIFQFGGWKRRNALSGRIEGELASHLTHPDVKKGFEEKTEEGQNFVRFMSLHQLIMWLTLPLDDLKLLRASGAPGQSVPEDLMERLNHTHHRAWMAARSLFQVLGLGKLGRHDAGKELEHLTPDQLANDDKQVVAYSGMLYTLPDELFETLAARD